MRRRGRFPSQCAAALLCTCALTLAGCSDGDNSFDTQSQVGPNPNLPEPQQYLFPPMHLASVIGWKEGEKPTVPKGSRSRRSRQVFSILVRFTSSRTATFWSLNRNRPPSNR
jgi:hypothetical protein